MENLKIRASAGRLGSDRAISNTMTYFSTASLSTDPIVLFGNTPQKYLSISRPVNPLLKWELTDTYNVGIESSMWNGLLGVEFRCVLHEDNPFIGIAVCQLPTFFGRLLSCLYELWLS